MNDNLFIPRVIKVGYQERTDTYTGRLAYVIYYDHKKKLRKETSWQSWRHNNINFDDFKNEPTSGFVLNKKAGGVGYSSWNPRQTYTRVYDPRGFEFEITIPNLLYILENANCYKGKGLDGEFVYAWSGTELLLIPVGAPDYKDMQAYADTLFACKAFKGKDLIIGATYKTNQNGRCVYLGRFDYFPHGEAPQSGKKPTKRYFFKYIDDAYNQYNIVSGLKGKIIALIDDTCVHNYSELMDELEHQHIYSPLDPTKYEYVPVTDDIRSYYYGTVYLLVDGEYIPTYINYEHIRFRENSGYDDVSKGEAIVSKIRSEHPAPRGTAHPASYRYACDIRAIHSKYPLHLAVPYLRNGNLRKE